MKPDTGSGVPARGSSSPRRRWPWPGWRLEQVGAGGCEHEGCGGEGGL